MKFEAASELREWAREAEHLWLFLDYDGTLAGFAPSPEHIHPDPQIISVVERLATQPGRRVTILSGRRLEHVRKLIPVPGIFLAGTYGIELVDANGQLTHRLEYARVRPALAALKPGWEELVRGRQGFFLEDKNWSLALHARFASTEEAEEVLVQAREAIKGRGTTLGEFRILGGHKFLEIAPFLASKRETVLYLLKHYPFTDARLLYMGDDDKDEEAFPVIHDQGGVAVKVRQASQLSAPTSADFFFESPAEALAWLERLLEA